MTEFFHANGAVPLGTKNERHWRTHLLVASEVLAIAVAASLPWSTSATAILLGLWLCAFLPVADWSRVRSVALSPVGGLPLALWLLAAASCLWSDVGWVECWRGLRSYHKLLLLPLFIAQFSHSARGKWVLAAYLASCTGVLAASYVELAWPALFARDAVRIGIPVKDYATQSTEFAICAFSLLGLAIFAFREARRRLAAGCAILAFLFLANVFYVATARASLLVILALLVLLGWRFFRQKGMAVLLVTAGVAFAAIWASSPYLRTRVTDVQSEIQGYVDRDDFTSTGMRLEFWRKSIRFIAEAPLLGHGAGAIRELFTREAAGQTKLSAVVTDDPHNQILKVGIELGSAGMLLLLALWATHVWLFARGAGLVAWFGLIVVAQNIVNSQFSTRLLDFTQGWTYVVLVGVLAGMLCRQSGLAKEQGRLSPAPA